jgi:hypothetical protein
LIDVKDSFQTRKGRVSGGEQVTVSFGFEVVSSIWSKFEQNKNIRRSAGSLRRG